MRKCTLWKTSAVSMIRWFASVGVFLAITAPSGSGYASMIPGTEADLVKAVLAENWDGIMRLQGDAVSFDSASVISLIKGHATLALNRNNESLKLFLTASSSEGLEKWTEWTANFVEQYPGSAIAWYLRGDALARQEQWNFAIQALNEALSIRPDFALALNARGVARCGMMQWEDAKRDFERAVELSPDLADGQANLGVLSLHRRETTTANDSYNRALNVSPDFALAMNGNACLLFKLGPKEWERANEEFAKAGNHLNLAIFSINADKLGQATVESMSKANLYFAGKDFTNWNLLRRSIEDATSVLHPHFQGVKLQGRVNRKIVDIFNEILEDQTFYDRHEEALQQYICRGLDSLDCWELKNLILETKEAREKEKRNLNAYDRSAIRGLNREILERYCSSMIKKTDTTEAGMSLTLTGGIAPNGYAYKQTLTTPQLTAGMHRMANNYMPMARFLQSTPLTSFLGNQWMSHLNNSYTQSQSILQGRNVSPSAINPGGVSSKEIMASFFHQADWPTVSMFGLGYNILVETK